MTDKLTAARLRELIKRINVAPQSDGMWEATAFLRHNADQIIAALERAEEYDAMKHDLERMYDSLNKEANARIKAESRAAQSVQSARAQERERCAKVCAEYASRRWTAYKNGIGLDRTSPHTEGETDGADKCAELIRALPEQEEPK